jgi:hypothetical protein
MNPWVKRTESNAKATMLHGSFPVRVLPEAAACVVPPNATPVMSLLHHFA